MKERPILFSAPMVRAILDSRKTQTRRILKQATGPSLSVGINDEPGVAELSWLHGDGPGHEVHETVKRVLCPYGQPSDSLWVRETWQGPLLDGDTMENEYRGSPDDFHKPEYCVYAADGGPPPEFVTQDDELVCRWRPSIHMPRWACRILLEITSVRVERLKDISHEDAMAEGMAWDDAVYDYSRLWESLNGPGSWDANPWVWVVEFKRAAEGN